MCPMEPAALTPVALPANKSPRVPGAVLQTDLEAASSSWLFPIHSGPPRRRSSTVTGLCSLRGSSAFVHEGNGPRWQLLPCGQRVSLSVCQQDLEGREAQHHGRTF